MEVSDSEKMSVPDQVMKFGHQAMWTQFELSIYGESPEIAESAAYQAFSLVDRIEMQISRFIAISEVAMIARLKPGDVYRVHIETMNLLLEATRICAATNGIFDVTLGPVMDLLRKVDHRWKALDKEELDSALASCGMNRLVLDPDHFMVSVKPDRRNRPTPLELDFGAIGKGYALDLARELLINEFEISNFMMHGGTSTAVFCGSMGDGEPGWTVTVGGNWRERAKLDTLRLSEGAISCSGFEEQGKHVVDPLHGIAAAKYDGAWSYAPSATWADGLSTAFLGMGRKEIEAACEALPGSGALLARDQAVWMDKVRSPVRTCGAFPHC